MLPLEKEISGAPDGAREMEWRCTSVKVKVRNVKYPRLGNDRETPFGLLKNSGFILELYKGVRKIAQTGLEKRYS